MVIKVYVSGISASQEVRKKQQRVLFILESLKVDHEVVDITDPGREDDRSFMREECTKGGKTSQLPPQIFSDQDYLGDYEDFEVATENEGLSGFLRLSYLESKLNNSANKQSAEEAQDGIVKEDQPQQNEGEPEGEPEAPSKLVNGNHVEDSHERDQSEGAREEESEMAVVDSTDSKEIGEGEATAEEEKIEEKEQAEDEEQSEEEED